MNKFIPIGVIGVLGLALGVISKSSLKDDITGQGVQPINSVVQISESEKSFKVVDQSTNLNQSLSRFEKTLASIENRLKVLEKGVKNSSPQELEDKELSGLGEEDRVLASDEKEYVEHTERLLSLDARLFEEEVDKDWADEMQERFTSDLENDELSGATISFSSCGSSLCKLELELEEGASTSEYLQRMSTQRSWDGPTFFTSDASGHIQLFIEREEAQL